MSPAREPDDADDADDADGLDARLSSLAGLGEPVRRALYRYVVAQPEPVSRDAAASGTGVARHVAKFHLDKLAADGLLEVEYRRPPGRTGPGAGRPTKLYRRSAREISVSLPARQYDLAGRVMAEAITSASRTGVPPADALHRVARDAGRALGDDARRMLGARRSRAAAIRAIADVLDANGFEPRVDAGGITLANCPFHSLSRQYTDLVCGMNLDLITGLVGSVEQSALSATLAPGPDRCCVTLTRSEADA
jgi:predicted ArsR family transcriptional regulator